MRPIALLLLLCAATPAFAADQFDMACQGTRRVVRGGPAQPATVRVHVDLAARRWCLDACQRVQAIVDVTDERITFQDDLVVNTREEATRETVVDRTTNAFRQTLIVERPEASYSKTEATCTVQPFTAFPASGQPGA